MRGADLRVVMAAALAAHACVLSQLAIAQEPERIRRRSRRDRAAAGAGHAGRAGALERAKLRCARPRSPAHRRRRGVPQSQREQRVAQFPDRQFLPARRQLSGLHGIGAARNAAGPVRFPGRRAHQRSVRRRRQLGPAAEERRVVDAALARIEPRVRAQHAGRRADDQHEGRLPLHRRRRFAFRRVVRTRRGFGRRGVQPGRPRGLRRVRRHRRRRLAGSFGNPDPPILRAHRRALGAR